MALLHRLGPLLGLVALSLILGTLSDRFLTVDNLINVFRQSSVNALLSLGQLVVIITAGIDLSAGSILGLSCVVSALLLKSGVPPAVSLIGALALGSALGATNGVLFTKLRLPHPFIPTLGMMNVARGVALVVSGGFPISELPSSFRFWGAGSVAGVPVPVIIVALSCGVFHVFLNRTTAGRDVYAIGGNAVAARLSGVPVDARLILVYTLSGFMAGAGAIVLAGRMNSGFPLAGVGAELDAIAAVIIGGASFFGGAGSVGGTLLGALIMGVLRNGLNLMNVNAYWQTIVIGGVIVIAVWVDAARKRSAERGAK
ncbi:MAG TPA: ABC transporter permease [Bryobacteraceae bacterium]|jgi:ribose transport system permease protein|nr:ABC transporter permease [Bryobacteraceae bacterium]